MSVEAVSRALERFSQEENNHAIVLKGDWGTGKTFLWNSIVKAKKAQFKNKNYSYVSLFGLTNLKDVKQAIFENTVGIETANLPISLKDLKKNPLNLVEKAKRGFRRGTSHASNVAIPLTRPLDTLVNSIQYSLTTDTLICIDDFERKSNSLQDRELLGLISNLVETKNCRVILILNSNTIKTDSDYYIYHEKVFSYEIEFAPTPNELIKLIFNEEDNLDTNIINSIISLKISNIRLYKKIRFFAEIIRPHITNKPQEAISQTLSTLVLAVWSIYGSSTENVDIDFILNFHGQGHYTDENADRDPEAESSFERKADILSGINFHSCDKLDEAIIKFVQNGYFDQELLANLINELEERISHNLKIEELRQAWRLYRNSYDDNETEVLDNFLSATDHCLPALDTSDINGICKLYLSLDRDDLAKELVDRFIDLHTKLRTPLEDEYFSNLPPYPYLIHKLEEHNSNIKPQRSILDILISSSENRNYRSEDIYQLSAIDSDDIHKIIKSLPPEYTLPASSYLLSMGNINAAGDIKLQEAFNSIFTRSFEAIMKIRDESLINRSRTHIYMKYERQYRELIEAGKPTNE